MTKKTDTILSESLITNYTRDQWQTVVKKTKINLVAAEPKGAA